MELIISASEKKTPSTLSRLLIMLIQTEFTSTANIRAIFKKYTLGRSVVAVKINPLNYYMYYRVVTSHFFFHKPI
jgi:hypothetical protein